MVPQCQCISVRTHVCRVALALVAVAALCAPFTKLACAQSDPIPSEIRNLKMGSTPAAVTEKIKSVGTVTTEETREKNRTKLVWTRPDIPSYKNIAFQFTEKNRLYLIRFTLSDAARADYHSIKRTIFKDFDFSWERPQKVRLPARDMLLYAPEKGMELYFVEFTDRKSHEKSFELFNRSISATDRPEPISVAKGNGQPPAPDSGQLPPQAVKPAEGATAPSSQPAQAVKENAMPAAGEKVEAAQPAAPATAAQDPVTKKQSESAPQPQTDQKPESK